MRHDRPTSTTRPDRHDPTLAAPAPERLAGGGYRVLRRLAQGGTAEVFEAIHLGLEKSVVVKILKAKYAQDRRAVERMRFEAQMLAQVRHPNIMAVSDCGLTADGRPFFVMEWVEGHPLLDELRQRGCLPVHEAVGLARQLCAGLSAAHALGVVHRDLKPENLFLGDDGTLKILDFGIAKLLPDADQGRVPAPPAIKSQDGVPLGTPQFLSPEQVMCRAVDARTDVYGAAMVLYELIAGRAPFHHHGTDHLALLEAHVSEAPRPPSALAPQPIEPAIDDVILRALSKRPEDRYASAAEFSAALDHALAMEPWPELNASAYQLGVRASARRAKHRGQFRLVALAVLGAALVSVVVTSFLMDRLP